MIGIIFCFGFALCLCLRLASLCFSKRGCIHEIDAHRSLPHRQEWELTRQGMSPSQAQCTPPLMPMSVEVNETTFFIGCYRENRNE
jgi:hypothetical protein